MTWQGRAVRGKVPGFWGGKSTSKAKQAAVRENGKKGGRPKGSKLEKFVETYQAKLKELEQTYEAHHAEEVASRQRLEADYRVMEADRDALKAELATLKASLTTPAITGGRNIELD